MCPPGGRGGRQGAGAGAQIVTPRIHGDAAPIMSTPRWNRAIFAGFAGFESDTASQMVCGRVTFWRSVVSEPSTLLEKMLIVAGLRFEVGLYRTPPGTA